MTGEISLNLENEKELTAVGKALSSDIRIRILRLLSREQLNVNEIAERLEIPASTSAMHVRVLEEAGLIHTELRPGVRGSMKVCSKKVDELQIGLYPDQSATKSEIISMPIGNYVDYKVGPTCGIVSHAGHIDDEDEPRCFYNPDRINAKLLWFGSGYVEYRFSNAKIQSQKLKSVEISAELCSETAFYNMDYPSEITLWVNGIDAGTWLCPSDFGGRRGKLNPDWWPDINTQFGKLKTWIIDKKGTYIDGIRVSKIALDKYNLAENPFISIRLGIKDEAKHIGGINIFGDSFGDYPQDIVMKIDYESSEE